MGIIVIKHLKIYIITLLVLILTQTAIAIPDSDSDDMSTTSSRHTLEESDDTIEFGYNTPSSSNSSRVWNKPGIPHAGWTHVGVQRLEEANGVCEMCDQPHIRFMHEVSHPKHPNLQVGITCADNMTSLDKKTLSKAERGVKKAYDKEQKEKAKRIAAQRQREMEKADAQRLQAAKAQADLHKKQLHKQKWITLESWRKSDRGNYVNSVTPGQTITIFKKGNLWGYVSNDQFSSQKFNTPQEAAINAYAQWFH